MKIAFIITSAIQTGPGIVVKDLCTGLIKYGHYCEVYYLDKNEDYGLPCLTHKLKLKEKIEFKSWDIIHTHTFRADLYGRIHFKSIKEAGCKLISTLHNPISISDINSIYPFFSSVICHYIWKWALKKFDSIIVLNAIVHKELIKYKYKNIKIIYNGRDLSLTSKQVNNSNINFNLSGNYIYIGTSSSLTKRKGLEQLIMALPYLPNFKLLLIGEGNQKSYLKELAKKLDVIDRVLFCGFQVNPIPYMKMLDIFILPSRSEGFPLALIEAAYLKKPCILSNIPILESIIPLSCVSFFQLDDINDLVNKILSIDISKGNLLYNFYKENLTLDIMVNNYLEIYN